MARVVVRITSLPDAGAAADFFFFFALREHAGSGPAVAVSLNKEDAMHDTLVPPGRSRWQFSQFLAFSTPANDSGDPQMKAVRT